MAEINKCIFYLNGPSPAAVGQVKENGNGVQEQIV